MSTDMPAPNTGDGMVHASGSTDDRTAQIQKQISDAPGYYALQAAAEAAKSLKADFDAGKLSQADYVKIAGSFLPQTLDRWNPVAEHSQQTWQSLGPTVTALRNQAQDYSIYKAGQTYLGRDITAAEMAQARPSFQGPGGDINGNAFLAYLAQQYKSNPSLDPGKAIKPDDSNSQVSQQFKSILGRDATQDELQHFSQAIQSGQTDAYGIGAFLKQMPEYTNAQDKTFREGLNAELQNYDTQEFGREKGDVMADYQKRGMAASPSLDYALTDLMGKIASNRSAYLSTLSASQYGGNKDLAVGNYQNSLNQMYKQNQQNSTNQSNYGNALMERGFNGMDYQTQMNDYMRMLGQSKGRSYNPMYGAIGGTIGAIGGAFAGGPAGAGAGYQIGSGLGNSYGYINQ